MKKKTGKIFTEEETVDVCDNCQTPLTAENWITFSFKWSDGWDNYGDEVNVCSKECLIKELRTHSRDTVFHPECRPRLYTPPDVMEDLLNSALGTLFPD